MGGAGVVEMGGGGVGMGGGGDGGWELVEKHKIVFVKHHTFLGFV